MRVIAGKYRGRRLAGPKHQGLRPTADRVKEALFNIIGARITDAVFLDPFAGTGAVGIEALSRGAARVVLADQNIQSIKLIRENLKVISPEDPVSLLHMPVSRALERLARGEIRFDIVFLDPPYEAGLLPETIAAIAKYRLLKENGVLVVEHPRKDILPDWGFGPADLRNYGDISLSFFMVK